jgi:hypothetical protein
MQSHVFEKRVIGLNSLAHTVNGGEFEPWSDIELLLDSSYGCL